MKTERQLIQESIEQANPKYIQAELEKQKICNCCPDKDDCWSCGCWRWWDA